MSGARPILIMAGGTGGHLFPALAVAGELQRRGFALAWIGTRAGLEARLVPQSGITIHWITVAGLRNKGLAGWLLAPLRLMRAVWQAAAIIRQLQPILAVGMGGFASGPGGLAARLSGCPLVVHEQNAIPGLTNRVLARIATVVLEAFPGSFPPGRHARHVGNPVRSEIAALPDPRTRLAGRTGGIRILVVGGSQGAGALNRVVPAAIAKLPASRAIEVWHQTGVRDLENTKTAYVDAGLSARVDAFIQRMAEAYGWADVVICRAGALTIAELAAVGLASVLIPFPAAVDDHQTRNAGWLVQIGAALLVPQAELTPDHLAAVLGSLFADRKRLLAMAERARERAMPDATRRVADACVALAGGVA